LVKYIGKDTDNKALREKLQDAGGLKATKYAASIRSMLDTSSEKFDEWIGELDINAVGIDPEYSSKVYKDNMKMFGNFENMQKSFYGMFDVNEKTGEIKVKSRYENMDTLSHKDITKDSWEKYIAQNVFGMELEGNWTEDLYNAMKGQLEKIDPERLKGVAAYGEGGQS
jgi:hypothetical protein